MKLKRYDFRKEESQIQAYWKEKGVFKANNGSAREKKMILGMFPYPSGIGLHTGHLLCYYIGCVKAHHARMQGYEVLHPIGFDAFGLPAEQHAIDTGEHPVATIKKNIATYTKLLQAAGISFDWHRSCTTTDPAYYRWTQWIFLQFYKHWYDKKGDRAAPITLLRQKFCEEGNGNISAACDEETPCFTAAEWNAKSSKEQEAILLHYRLAYRSEANVNWCPALGTVLANDEVKDGYAERGGHPVVQKKMKQWQLRMTAYADRLLQGLETLDWPEEVKAVQRQWIGRSEGTEVHFACEARLGDRIKVFTTRVDTLYGVSYLALAPEHPMIDVMLAQQRKMAGSNLTDATPQAFTDFATYVSTARKRSELSKKKDNQISGAFTHFYAIHPITQQKIPIWVADYVLGGYGSGAVMGVPAHDERDYRFAQHFGLPIIQVISGGDIATAAHTEKEGVLMNAGDLDGFTIPVAQAMITQRLVEEQKGKSAISYRLRDAVFSRQRYWGEPFPIYYRDGMPHPLSEAELPLKLPEVDSYKPSAAGEPPLSRAAGWHTATGDPLEHNTMPSWAGSNWYFLRYMDPNNTDAFVGRPAVDYWRSVDLYVGGKEHATGHLIYARFCTKFLYDTGLIPMEEPFQELVTQGIILPETAFAYRIKNTNQFVSYGKKDRYDTVPFRVSIDLVQNNILDQEAFKAWRPHLADATFILEGGQYVCGSSLEKMSKSKHNIVDPQRIIEAYGADVLRLHVLFLGPVRQSKPWSIQGIEGMVRFLKKIWRLFHQQGDGLCGDGLDGPALAIQQIIHKATKQVTEGLTRYTFNTSISALMVCVNQLLTQPSCHPAILQDFLRLLAPFAPHMAEFLWQRMGEEDTLFHAGFPTYDPAYLEEPTITYPVAVNGRKRAEFTTACDTEVGVIEREVIALPGLKKWIGEHKIAKIIIVPKRMINVVLA